MKYRMNPTLSIAIILLLGACQSREKVADDIAFDDVKKEKMNEKDTVVRIITDTSQVTVVKNTVQMVEWSKFEIDLRNRISANEAMIKTLRQSKKISESRMKYEKNIGNIEKENNELKKRLAAYSEEQKKFQDKMNRDISSIDKQLKDLSAR